MLCRTLEQSSAELLEGIPRGVEEINSINEEAAQSREFLQQLLQQLTQADQQNTVAVRFLSGIDSAKERVGKCIDTLHQVCRRDKVRT